MVSAEEVTEDVIGAVMDRDGAIPMKKAPRTVARPASSEQLRQRIRILGITFQLAAYKHSSRRWLQTTSMDVWRDHADFILSDDIYGFSNHIGDREVRAPWQVVLSYEFQVRKAACRLIMFDHLDLKAAMAQAARDPLVKEKFFSTPVSLSNPSREGSKRAADEGSNSRQQQPKKKAKGDGRASSSNQSTGGKGGSGAKGGKKGKQIYANTKTPDGRSICFRYQDGSCKGKKCSFVHVCATCLGAHPMNECIKAAGA